MKHDLVSRCGGVAKARQHVSKSTLLASENEATACQKRGQRNFMTLLGGNLAYLSAKT